MSNFNIFVPHFRIELQFHYDGEYQKTIVYLFKDFPSLVSFVYGNLKLLEQHSYSVHYKDVVLDVHLLDNCN